MAELSEWFNQLPLITRYWFAGSVAVPVLCRFNVFSPYSMILTPDFLGKLHLWKPLTALLYYPLSGNTGFRYLMNLYFMYNYSIRLERGHFNGRTADYLFMLLFNWLSLVILSWAFFTMVMLMDPMIMSVVYIYCMLNQDQVVSFWFGTRFKARYLPWALFGMNFLLGGGGIYELVGIIVGHLYYFVMIRYPAEQGIVLLSTPQILYKYFPSDGSTVPTVPLSATRPSAPPANQAPSSGHNWGRGQRLED